MQVELLESDRSGSEAGFWLPPISGALGAEATVVVVGTVRTAVGIVRQLRTLDDPPAVAGWIEVPVPGEPVAGLKRLGTSTEISAACARAGAAIAIVSLPAAMRDEIATIRAELRRAGVVERFVPPLEEVLAHAPAPVPAGLGGPKVDVATLVGRSPRAMDTSRVERMVQGKTVLVTGAGGSIGGELARLVAGFGPERLVLVERSENALFEIDRQIAGRRPGLARTAALHDVVEAAPTRALFEAHKPDVVFHAAAHKHVPLMEDHPAHAVINNVFGTRSVAEASAAVGAERFVLISSDKAVRPSSVMGSTKRIAEMVVGALGQASSTRMSMVRFGNVLGSAGSVLPIWTAQLSEGGPITVTDQRMTRYFMTIPEAASLVLQAGALAEARRSNLYVLDMGQPVSILDLAVRFAEAHGLRAVVRDGTEPKLSIGGDSTPAPGLDAARGLVDIVITGARPGEKLHEELAYAAESLTPTACPGVLAHGYDGEVAPGFDVGDVCAGLERACRAEDRDSVVRALARLTPELGRHAGV